jgi:hypothetical protein
MTAGLIVPLAFAGETTTLASTLGPIITSPPFARTWRTAGAGASLRALVLVSVSGALRTTVGTGVLAGSAWCSMTLTTTFFLVAFRDRWTTLTTVPDGGVTTTVADDSAA